MATEATTQDPVESLLDNSSSTVNHDASNPEPAATILTNGESDATDRASQVDKVDSVADSAEASVNGASDNEATRSAASRDVDGPSLVRSTSAIKKPISFKAVSVNKTFLATKGSAATATSKLGDKGLSGSTAASSTATLSAKPRLVAKLGTGPKTTLSGGSGSFSGGAGAVPSASAVWNKNQPAPPPEQKRITDEELSQKYGIHLATRLQSDEPGRQANWADIEDDDDDWAPESIEWTDGTKISLPVAEEPAPMPKPATPPVPAQKTPVPEIVAPKPLAPTVLSSTVKLGGISSTSGKGLVLRGAPEKPTLVAKPPGPPTPVKSPWASLPPIDKVAPINVEPQQQPPQSQQPTFARRHPHGFDAMPPPPAKEIAADDFSRTWRDSSSSANRELYNSQSGRYEPVNDGRHGSMRLDGQARQPALLQRPSHDQQGPAEPSSAFQTHRTAGQDGSFSRRRASSTLSGTSGTLGRRLSKGQDLQPMQDPLAARRGSMATITDGTSGSGTHQADRMAAQRDSSQAQPSPATSQVVPEASKAPVGPPIRTHEDDVELQKKIMRESREQARKRRLEEEAREEAEKKERIRLKLKAMGPAPESKRAMKELPKEEKPVPVQIQARETPAPSQSAPIPTENIDDSKQQESLRVQQTPPEREASLLPSASHDEPTGFDANRPSVASSPIIEKTQAPQQLPIRHVSNPAPERYSTWGSSNPAAGRIWGPPTNDKTLGNGTFNPNLSRLPEIQNHQQLSPSDPGPIGPPGSFSRSNNAGFSSREREQRPLPIGPPRSAQPAPNQHMRQATAAWANLPEQLANENRQQKAAQDERDAAKRELENSESLPSSGVVYRDTWKQTGIKEDGSRSSIMAVEEQLRGLEGKPISASTAWTISAAQREAEHARNNRLGNVRPSVIGTPAMQPSSDSSYSTRGYKAASNRDIRLEDQDNNFAFLRSGSPSPPPPDMLGHPAYDCDLRRRPIVSLPRPVAIVRLPPPQVRAPPPPPPVVAPPKPMSWAAAAATPIPLPAPLPPPQVKPQSTPAFSTGDQWQNRIDSLMGRGAKPSPPKVPALLVNASSRSVLEDPVQAVTATVSLPATSISNSKQPSPQATPAKRGKAPAAQSQPKEQIPIELPYQTKPPAEECFEEQEMGSLPPVRIPKPVPHAVYQPVKRSIGNVKPVVATSIPDHKASYPPNTIRIALAGMEKSIIVKIEGRQNKSNSKRTRGNASRQASSTLPRDTTLSREGSSSIPSPSVDQPPAASGRARGGRGRGNYGGNWSQRQVSANAVGV